MQKESEMGSLVVNGSWVANRPIHNFGVKLPFSSLRGEALAEFVAIAPEVSYSRGELLFLEGEAPKHVFVICSGKVKLTVTSRDGKVVVLRVAGPGGILGLSAAMSSAANETSAEATEPCRVKAIRVSDFLGFLQAHPEASAEVTTCLLSDYRVALNNVCRLAMPATVAGRLASLLLEWLDARPAACGNERRLILTLTQEEIASMINTSRETVSRILHQFQEEKLISIKGVSVTVLESEALEDLAA
jgi:CRP/FNR family transcriptional regulator